MADNQSQIPSTVAPSDSASASGRKPKPGKAERAARRSAVGSQPGNAASAAKAFSFASGVSVPKPQPGKFPVVFQTGAGEPSRDLNFAIDGSVLQHTLGGFPARFTFNAKYNEFKMNSDITDKTFASDVGIAGLLRLAQQVVHSHVNMGLPQGDFAPMASTEVKVPSSLSAYLSQFGEFSVPALGTRFLLSDYDNTVRRLVWAAEQMRRNGNDGPYSLERIWLPVRSGDRHTKLVIADCLQSLLRKVEVEVDDEVLQEGVLSGSVPNVWEGVKMFLGETDSTRDRFDFLFKSYRDAPQFVTAFTTAAASAVLTELGLSWRNPVAGHVDWNFNAKELFTSLSDAWARKSATYALFFELSSSQANRPAAMGSQAQMAHVSTHDSITIVKTHLALSANEFSLVSCFPSTGIFTAGLARRVVLTTPLSVTQRATEFVQMDWR
uniref:Coat protein n=1 Tax=Plasmopara viticola lesion associated Partitivirus 1 TaxID=2691998 RepID=A0A6B9Q473_9VIRU|nr:coat protein [Plasmopara viticola lesion associated Partitivirus 1]